MRNFLTVCLLLIIACFEFPAHAEQLHLFAGAGLRQPTDCLIHDFEKRTGHKVLVDYGGSGQLLTRIVTSGQGDLFMPGSFYYIEKLVALDRVHSFGLIVAHTPVVGVNHKKAESIKSLEDLGRPGVRIALGDPKAMALGRTAMEILDRSGLKEAILKNVVVYGATVKQLALYVANGDVDASIIGRADAFQYKDRISIVRITQACGKPEKVAMAVLKPSPRLHIALKVLHMFQSDSALEVFKSFGFLPLAEEVR
jgi:molybdate transport system substrate-binding protein